jgi:hypothetical protein
MVSLPAVCMPINDSCVSVRKNAARMQFRTGDGGGERAPWLAVRKEMRQRSPRLKGPPLGTWGDRRCCRFSGSRRVVSSRSGGRERTSATHRNNRAAARVAKAGSRPAFTSPLGKGACAIEPQRARSAGKDTTSAHHSVLTNEDNRWRTRGGFGSRGKLDRTVTSLRPQPFLLASRTGTGRYLCQWTRKGEFSRVQLLGPPQFATSTSFSSNRGDAPQSSRSARRQTKPQPPPSSLIASISSLEPFFNGR